jgi:hypothetical protein
VWCLIISVIPRSSVACPVCHSPRACAYRSRWSGSDGDTPRLAAQAAAGPGFWEDLLGELRRKGLISALLAGGVITAAVAEADHGHKLDRVLTAEVTAMCVITGALFPGQGYDLVLARTSGMPGPPLMFWGSRGPPAR